MNISFDAQTTTHHKVRALGTGIFHPSRLVKEVQLAYLRRLRQPAVLICSAPNRLNPMEHDHNATPEKMARRVVLPVRSFPP